MGKWPAPEKAPGTGGAFEPQRAPRPAEPPGPAPESAKSPTPQESKPRRRHRVRNTIITVVIVLIVVVAVLVAMAPYLLSTDTGTRAALGLANSQILGKVSAADLTTSWGGPTEIRGVHVADPQGRDVLSAPRISYSGGLWKLIFEPVNFKQAVVESPAAVIYLDKNGHNSLSDASRREIHRRRPRSKPPAGLGRRRSGRCR